MTTEKGISSDIQNRDTLLVSFGGINQGLGMPVFEFARSIASVECDKLYLRDFAQQWYQKGIDSEIDNIASLINLLKATINERKYKKVCFLGNSMGGYAAILFGTILNVDTIVSFSPQTYIDKWNRFLYWDRRWKQQISEVHKNSMKISEYFDLRSCLSKHTYRTQIDIYYSPKHRLDKTYANRLKNLPNVNLKPIDKGGHAIIKTIRDEGRLLALINNALLTT
ncbi:MAG: hypothetical protein ACJA2S_004807 [Cyclobacteriaceae bacterium]